MVVAGYPRRVDVVRGHLFRYDIDVLSIGHIQLMRLEQEVTNKMFRATEDNNCNTIYTQNLK